MGPDVCTPPRHFGPQQQRRPCGSTKKNPQVHQGTSAVCGPHKNVLLTTGNIRSLLRPFRLEVAPDTACGNPVSGRKMEGDFAEGERPWRNVYRDEDFHLLYNMVCATLSLWKLLIHLKKKKNNKNLGWHNVKWPLPQVPFEGDSASPSKWRATSASAKLLRTAVKPPAAQSDTITENL